MGDEIPKSFKKKKQNHSQYVGEEILKSFPSHGLDSTLNIGTLFTTRKNKSLLAQFAAVSFNLLNSHVILLATRKQYLPPITLHFGLLTSQSTKAREAPSQTDMLELITPQVNRNIQPSIERQQLQWKNCGSSTHIVVSFDY